jgi:1-acyl-sn-glycerol-3-phosphate acyltransferase
MKALSSALTWAAIVTIVLLALPTVALVRLFDRDPARYRAGRVFRVMGSWAARINPAWRVTITGTPPADLAHPVRGTRRPYVVVSNHQSNADIPLVSMLPWEMKWVAKQELFDLPVFGWLMRLAGDIPVDRRDPESRAAVLLRAGRVLERRCSVMFFAEGTRSRDGRLKAFQDGAFRLAIQTGVPVLPLAVDGTKDALPTLGWQFDAADVRLHVFEPIETAGLGEADVPALREQVRATIRDRIAAWREAAPEAVDALAAEPA